MAKEVEDLEVDLGVPIVLYITTQTKLFPTALLKTKLT